MPLCIYLFFSFVLIEKDFFVYTDEVSFTTYAYQMYNQDFGDMPFDKRLTVSEKHIRTLYGPVYPLVAGLFFQIFGLSIYTARGFSILMGFATLVMLYILLHRFTKSPKLSALGVLILGIDMNFLRAARFGRPETFVLCTSLVAIYYYLINFKKITPRKLLILAAIGAVGFFAHFLMGTIVFISISIHQLLIHKNRKILVQIALYMALPLIFLFIGWNIFIQQTTDPVTLEITKTLLPPRYIPNFYLLKMILFDPITFNALTLISYIGYILIFAVMIRKRGYHKLFWIITAGVSVIVVMYGSTFTYGGVMPVFIVPLAILALHNDQTNRPSSVSMVSILITFVLMLSLFQQLRLISYHWDYSYISLGKETSKCIPKGNHNVYITNIMPHDPYFYLIANRPDLRIAYRRFQDESGENIKRDFPKVDYVVTYGALGIIYDPRFTDEFAKQFNMDITMVSLFREKTSLVCLVKISNQEMPPIAVLKVNPVPTTTGSGH